MTFSFLTEFYAVFVKTFLLSIRKSGQTLVEILLAYMFLGLLLSIRHILDRKYHYVRQIPRFQPQSTMLFNESTANLIFYYPSNPCTDVITNAAMNSLQQLFPQFPTSLNALDDPNLSSLSNSIFESIYAYIQFDNLNGCTSPRTMPDQIEYTLRMPENGRNYYRADQVKRENVAFFWKYDPKDTCYAINTFYNYIIQFVGVQYALDLSIIKYATNTNQKKPVGEVYLNHFVCPEIHADQLHSIYGSYIVLFFAVIFSVTFIVNVGFIIEERETKTKEYLHIFGLHTWINNFVWIIRSMCIYIVLTSVVTGVSYISFEKDTSSDSTISKAIFNHANWIFIWIILFIYSIQLSMFSVFIGQFFKKVFFGKFFSLFISIVTTIDFYQNVPIVVRYILCIFPNTGLLFCIQVVLQYERDDCEFGIPQPFYYCLKKSYWLSKYSSIVKSTHTEKINNRNTLMRTNVPIIRIINLTKEFDKTNVISNINLECSTGEIHTLLGHNGAGKTTIILMLAGMLKPTSGKIIINGLEQRMNIKEMRKIIGFCPQYDILYDELSTEEHLKLFSRIRRLDRNKMKDSINRILNLIDLTKDRMTLSKDLSGGMKRRLSIGISIIGDSKILIFDEPTSSIDPFNRRLVWKIIRKMKEMGKCVIISTHFLDEADILSDRITIINNGRIQASGTPNFLKSRTEFQYHIFIEKEDNVDTHAITRFVQHKIKSPITLETETPTKLVYGISQRASKDIGQLLNALDMPMENLGIKEYELSTTTIEDVFFQLINEEKNQNQTKILKNLFNRNKPESRSWKNLWALLVKRWILSYRQSFFLFFFFLVPIILEIIITATLPSPQSVKSDVFQLKRIRDAKVTLLPSIYNPQTIVIYSDNNTISARNYLNNYLTAQHITIESINTNDVQNYVVKEQSKSKDILINKYQIGFSLSNSNASSFESFTIDAFFSTIHFHAIPTSLSVATTTIFQHYANSSSKQIITNNQPILTKSNLTGGVLLFENFQCFNTFPLSILNTLTSFIAASFISILAVNLIRERRVHSKQLQLLTNTSKRIYWLSNFLFDITICLIISGIITIVFKVVAISHTDPDLEIKVYNRSEELCFFFLTYVLYSFASLPLIYSFSFIQNSEFFGSFVYFLLSLMLCLLDITLVFIGAHSQTSIKENKMTETTHITSILRWPVAILSPAVNLQHTLFNIQLHSNTDCILAVNSIQGFTYSLNVAWLSIQEPGLGIQYLIFLGQIIVWWIILILIENSFYFRRFLKTHGFNFHNYFTNDENVNNLDKDVRNEREQVLNENVASTSAIVLIRNLIHQFKKRKQKSLRSLKYTIIDHLNFRVIQNTCFGLLGVNGSGKTTLFRMLINDLLPTSGDIFINRKQINKSKSDFELGFCPQSDWLIENLNVLETLTLFGRLNNLSGATLHDTTRAMAFLFGLETYNFRQVQKLSGGNKRKLSAALAFMANQPLIIMDEPTTGLDVSAKRKVWNIIDNARKYGMTIIMASHSMEECETVCDTIGIMNKGQFTCLGSLNHLKKRFGYGYILQIKVSLHRIKTFEKEFIQTFPDIRIQDQRGGLLSCDIPISLLKKSLNSTSRSTLASLIKFLNEKTKTKLIETYSIMPTTLEQIFLHQAEPEKRENAFA